MEIVKGSSVKIAGTAYTYFGDTVTSTKANITGGVIKLYVKQRDGDSDASAILTKTGTIVDALNGGFEILIAAADTNTLSYKGLVCEIVVKDNAGSYLRNGVEPFVLLPNVGKTLF